MQASSPDGYSAAHTPNQRVFAWALALSAALSGGALACGALLRSPALALAGLFLAAQAALLLWAYAWRPLSTALAPLASQDEPSMHPRLLADGIAPGRFEAALGHKNGSRVPVEIASKRLQLASGSESSAIMVRDIIERKRAEEALHDSQHLLLSIAEASPDLIYVWDVINNQDVFVNRATPTMLGYSNDQIEQMGADFLRTLMHPDDAARLPDIQAHYHLLREGEIFENEYRMRDASGNWRWFYSRDLAFTWAPNGQPQLMIGTSQEITPRKQAEEALTRAYEQLEILNKDLRRSGDLLRTLFDKLKDGLLLLNQEGHVLAINQALATLLGATASDVTGQPWLALCEQATTTPAPCAWVLDALQDGVPRQERERLTLPDGTLRIIDVEVFPLFNAEHDVEQLILHTVDVTERLQIEAQMIEQERFAASGRLAATVAHEVNTPLQAVESCLHMVERASGERRAEYLKIARDEVIRVGRILQQLLDIFRPSQNQRVPIDANALIGRVLLLTGSTLAKQGIDVESDLAPDLPAILGHGDEIAQVLLNLVLNASHAMPSGGVLTLKTASTIAGADGRAIVRIDVADSGIGMSDAVQARIFEPFFTTKPNGSGLGLAVCQKIVSQHGGSIFVRSGAGAGSTFTITLPLADDITRTTRRGDDQRG